MAADDEPELDLVSAFEPFAALLRSGGFESPGDGGWSVEQVAAHLVRNNEHLAALCREVLAGGAGRYDNEPVLEAAELSELAAGLTRSGGPDGLADRVLSSAADLRTAFEGLSQEQRSAPLPVVMRTDGQVVLEGERTLEWLVRGNATFHLASHQAQAEALLG